MDAEVLLTEGIQALCKDNIETDHLIAPREKEIFLLLSRYIKEIELFNPAYGLVGTQDTNELIVKHILDSLAPLGIISRLLTEEKSPASTLKIADAGSGAGLPGIPLAISLPQNKFTLIERMGRRAGFLMNTKAVLALSNITVEENEIEKTARNQFDIITFRAFKPLEPKLLKTLFKLCAPNGIIAAYKGKHDKIEQEMAPLQEILANWRTIPYTVPFLNEERRLLVIKAK